MEVTITVLGPSRMQRCPGDLGKLKTKEVMEDSDDNPDPPTMHMLFMSPEHEVVFYISGYRPDRAGDKFPRSCSMPRRCDRHASPRRARFPGEVECVSWVGVDGAAAGARASVLARAQHRCRARPEAPVRRRRAARGDRPGTKGGQPRRRDAAQTVAAADPGDKFQQSQLARLNAGQRAALSGLEGAMSIVQGPPGTGKSSFVGGMPRRVPKGARILACTATNKAIDSLVASGSAG